MPRRVALTFTGNPHSPIDNFEDWFNWDQKKATICCGVLAAASEMCEETPPDEQDYAHEAAIDEIVDQNVTGYFEKFVDEW